VHVVHDYRRQRGPYVPTTSVINAIIVNSTTTMVGFGSMMIAAHRGLYSLGLVLTIGVGTCLVVAVILLPAVLTLVSRRRKSPAGAPARETGAAANFSPAMEVAPPESPQAPVPADPPAALPFPAPPHFTPGLPHDWPPSEPLRRAG
jgi:hypothetical protein